MPPWLIVGQQDEAAVIVKLVGSQCYLLSCSQPQDNHCRCRCCWL